MTADLLLAFVLFAFATAGTPGPNNMMLLASGANFGFRRTLRHILGVSFGVGLMVVALGWGLAGLFAALPILHQILRWVGAAYLLWLAWKIATAAGVSDRRVGGQPMTFLQAVAFQWLNPKAWAMALGAVSTYTPPGGSGLTVLLVAGLFILVCAPCNAAWAGFGQGLRPHLDRPGVLRTFNAAMAALLVASLYPLFVESSPAGPVIAPRDIAAEPPPLPVMRSHG